MSRLFTRSRGEGPPVLLIHGTGTGSSVFDRSAATIGENHRVIACDRRGWGSSPPGPDYRRTSVAEQAIEIAGSLADGDRSGPLAVAGIGLGAVIALELALAEPELVATAVMVEPPVLGLLPEATAGVSADVERIRATVTEAGEGAAYELFLTGGLPTLGAGAERFADVADRGGTAARACLVELPAVPAWPLDPARLVRLEAEVTVATCASTPPLLNTAAATLADRIPGCRRAGTAAGPADAPAELLA